jgi:hypothetical protein
MGRKKRRAPTDVRIFCWYCERNFDSEHELVHHQKEKHLRCSICHKRMVSTSGLVVHAMQVHKRAVTVPNAIDGRDDPKAYDVFGMQGIPTAVLTHDANEKANKRGRGSEVPATPPTQPLTAPMYVPPVNFFPPSYFPVHTNGVPFVAAPAWTARHGRMPSTAHAAGGHTALRVSSHAGEGSTVPPGVNPRQPELPLHVNGTVAPAPVLYSGSDVGGASQLSTTPKSLNNNTVTIVFDRGDVCMEELRAKLPRYRSS